MKLLTVAKDARGLAALLMISSTLFLTGCGKEDGKNPVIPGVRGPILETLGDGLLLTMVFENLGLNAGVRYAIPEYEESYLELGPDVQSSGTLLGIFISYEDVFGNKDYLKSLDAQTLPGGRPIPGLATGRLPGVAFSIPEWHDVAFYLGDKLYMIFVPLDLDLNQAIATFRFYSAGRRVGNISLVGNDANDENGGVAIALDLNSSSAKYVKKKAGFRR